MIESQVKNRSKGNKKGKKKGEEWKKVAKSGRYWGG